MNEVGTSSKFPFGKYGVPGLFSVTTTALYTAEQHFSNAEWWPDVPWLWMTICGLLFLAGVIYADIQNPRSQLVRWLYYKRRVFEVLAFATGEVWDEETRTRIDRVTIWCKIKFLKNMSGQKLIIRVVAPLGVEESRQRSSIVHSEELGEVVKDQEKRITIANVTVTHPMSHEEQEQRKAQGKSFSPLHTAWGNKIRGPDILDGQYTIIPLSKNRIEISIGPQTYKAFAQFLDPTNEQSNRVFLITQDEHLTI